MEKLNSVLEKFRRRARRRENKNTAETEGE